MRGNGPRTGYGYLFYTRPHFLAEDLYLRLVIPPGYFISELIYDKWPSQHSGVGVSGGLWAESQAEWRDGRFEKAESFSGHAAEGPLAYYLREPKIAGVLPLEGQIRAKPQVRLVRPHRRHGAPLPPACVHLQILDDYARVDYIKDHRLPHSGLAGVGANLSVALTKRITLSLATATASTRHATIRLAVMTSTRSLNSSTKRSGQSHFLPRPPRTS